MTIDVTQFHPVFFEESFEGLELMETGLLQLPPGSSDTEQINSIFRAAHSIKGGAGSFGFRAISDFTHGLETLLDELRNGQRSITAELTALLLQAVDVLREMLLAEQHGVASDNARVSEVSRQLQSQLALATDCAPEAEPPLSGASSSAERHWHIQFRPFRHLMQTGNDPLLLFRQLATLGELTVSADTSAMPGFVDLEPEDCYLSWSLRLSGAVEQAEIAEVFDWVEDDCELEITALEANEIVAVTAPAESIGRAGPQPGKTPVQSAAAGSSIRVATDKVDSLIDLVGELVITQSMLSQLGEDFAMERLSQLRDGLEALERNTRQLQEGIMGIRMLPISFSFNRLPRLVHDLSAKMGKQVELRLSGGQTELDKTVMEKIGDPLVHLVRNSLDHGLETPAVRQAAGKPAIGVLQLNAYHQGGNIVIEISDDGAGLDAQKILATAQQRGLVTAGEMLSREQIHELIFMPGFSTAEAVSDVSGRGVGMDVVRKNIYSLGGQIELQSEPGIGSTFIIRLPLTLAIMDGQSITVAGERFIIPLIAIVESVEIKPEDIKSVAGKGELFKLREQYIPLIRLYQVFNLSPEQTELTAGLLVIVESEGQLLGLFVDDLLGQQQVVIKSLETNYRKVTGFSGATILGDGAVALILDVPGILALYRDDSGLSHPTRGQAA